MTKANPGQDKNQPRRDEERDRWREGGYRGHATEDFGPEAREDGGAGDLHGEQASGDATTRKDDPGHVANHAPGPGRSGTDAESAKARGGDRPATKPYTGFSEPGGRASLAPRGGYGGPKKP